MAAATIVVPQRAITWSRPPVSFAAGMPAARGGHASVMVGNLMIVCGGTYYDQGKFHYLADVWALDVDAMRWHKPVVAGKGAPGARYGHAAVAAGTCVYLFGGRGEGGLLYNDLWRLDVEKWTWELLPSTSAPPAPRMGHSLMAIDGKLAVAFGWDGKLTTFADFWVYDPAAVAWSKPRVGGALPPPRYGAACTFAEANARVVVFGGASYDSAGHPLHLKDTRELDLRAMAWARSRVSGDYPEARHSHASTVIGNVMVCFGGWRGPATAAAGGGGGGGGGGDGSSGAGGDGGGDTIVIPFKAGMGYGSEAPPASAMRVPLGVHAGTAFLDLDTLEWVAPQVAGKPPGYRYGATAVSVGLQVLCFGGWEDGRALSETLVLDMEAIAASG